MRFISFSDNKPSLCGSSVCSCLKLSMNKQSNRNCSKQFTIMRLHCVSYPCLNHNRLKTGLDWKNLLSKSEVGLVFEGGDLYKWNSQFF